MSENTIDPRAILAKLEEIRAETLRRLADLSQEELDWRSGTKRADTGADEWSLGEVFMHIAIDEHHLRENIARPLLEGVKPPESIEFRPPPPPYGLPKNAILFWFERTRLLTRRLLENWPAPMPILNCATPAASKAIPMALNGCWATAGMRRSITGKSMP